MSAPRTKSVHRAKSIRADGSVSAVCFRTPRAIDLRRAGWSNRWEAVTCPRCMRARVVLPGEEVPAPTDHAQRWRALPESTQWAVIFDLASKVKIREYKLAHWGDDAVNKDDLRDGIEVDRALLSLVQPVTSESVFADAYTRGSKP